MPTKTKKVSKKEPKTEVTVPVTAPSDKETNPTTIALIVLALLIFGIIGYLGWNNKFATPTTKTGGTTQTGTVEPTPDLSAEVNDIGPNEVKFTAANFKTEVEDAKGVVVVDAYAAWCPHCQKMAPVMTEVSNIYKGKAKIGKLSANNQDPLDKENFDFAVNNGLESYPTVWIYKDGKKVDTSTGALTKEELSALIDKYL
ncbi:MAG: thioredoxin domain-containing protein [bacterium]